MVRYLIAFIIALMLNGPSCAEVLTLGTLAFDPPFETAINKKGNFYGFEMELMSAICARIHYTCRYKAMPFQQLLRQTLTGEIDIAIAGITITPEREEMYLFSLPYLVSKAHLLTNSTSTLTTITELEDKRVGVEAGTLFKELALQKIKNVHVVEYNTQNDLFQAIANDNIDAIMLDQASAQYWVNNNGNIFKLLGPSMRVGIGYGLMANKSQSKLIHRINQALIEIENDGTYLAIYEQYF